MFRFGNLYKQRELLQKNAINEKRMTEKIKEDKEIFMDIAILANKEPDSEEHDSLWTWKDTLQRILYLDTIIDQIVRSAILLDTIFFGALGVLLSQGMKPENGATCLIVSILISAGASIINFALSKSLARQEYIRRWFFCILPKNIPFMPNENWVNEKKNELEDELKKYRIRDCGYEKKVKTPEDIFKGRKLGGFRLRIIRFGNADFFGYCEMWILILFLLSVIFFMITLLVSFIFHCNFSLFDISENFIYITGNASV